jgi:HSP20 family protein
MPAWAMIDVARPTLAGRREDAPEGARRKRPSERSDSMATITRWDPMAQLERLQHEIDRLFDGGAGSAARLEPWLPAADIEQTGDSVVYKLDLPGMKREDITIQAHAGALTVSGERKRETEDTHEGYYSRERVVGSFARTFTLPEGTGEKDIAATFADGVLTITVPRKEEAKPRTIAIAG